MELGGHLHAQVALPTGKELPVPIGYETGWAPEPIWTLWNKEKSLASPGNRTPAVQPVVLPYTD
jgi:hypothetical protein